MGQGHARTVSDNPGMDLVGVADPSPKTHKLAEDFGVIAFKNYDELIEKENPQAIIVASPSNTHGEVVMKCCQVGIHVFCEKPFTTTFQESIEVRDAVKSSDIVFTIGLVLRHTETYGRAKEMVSQGLLGGIGMADCRYSGNLLGRYEYVFSKNLGRGLINEHTIHMIDAMEYILGPVESVLATTDASKMHTEYNAAMILKHRSGSFTSITASGVSTLSSHAWITGQDLEILIENNTDLLTREDGEEKKILSTNLGYDREIEDFRRSIVSGKKPLTGIDEAFASSRLIEAIYRSSENGEQVEPLELESQAALDE